MLADLHITEIGLFSVLDSDRHTWLPGRRRQGRKPADRDTAGEAQTEQRRQSKVRYSTTCMDAALPIVACPCTQTVTMFRTLRSTVLHPDFTGLCWCCTSSLCSPCSLFLQSYSVVRVAVYAQSNLFQEQKYRQLISTLSSVDTSLLATSQTAVCLLCSCIL